MASSLATSLGLNATWSANVADMLAGTSLVSNPGWNATSASGGLAYYAFVTDPLGSAPVIQIKYPAGSFASPQSGIGGAQFSEIFHTGMPTMLLEYDVYFPSGFQWNLGGKLPGLYGGAPGLGCSGGISSTGECWSVRVMWRSNGAGEVYSYLSPENQLDCSRPNFCDSSFGTSFQRGAFTFQTGVWTSISLYVQLNNPAGYNNGHIWMYVNGNKVISQDHIIFTTSARNNSPVLSSALFFSAFYGGGTPSYAAPADTYNLFRSFAMSSSSNYSTTSSARPSHPTNIQTMTLLVSYSFFAVLILYSSL